MFTESDLISSYSRAQAIADGMLIDVTSTAKESGFRVPVALTAAAWADCVAWTEADSARQIHQDQSGRLWDVLWMGFLACRRSSAPLLFFELSRVPCGGKATRARLTKLKAMIGPGDHGEPVITILLPDED